MILGEPYNWRSQPPRGWRLRGLYLRLTLLNIANLVLSMLVGVITGFWLWAEIVVLIWVLYAIVTWVLAAARYLAEKRDQTARS